MGGTTAKASLIENGAIARGREYRGGRVDLRGQPADPRLGRAAAHPDGSTSTRSAPAAARSRTSTRPAGSASARAPPVRRPAPPATASAAPSRPFRRERRARPHRPRPVPGGRDAPRPGRRDTRRPCAGAEPLGLTLLETAEGIRPSRTRAWRPRSAPAHRPEGPRPARVLAGRVRRGRAAARGRAGRGARRDHGARATGGRPVQRRRPAVRPAGVPRRAHLSPRRRYLERRGARRPVRRDGGTVDGRTRRHRADRLGAQRRPPLPRAELGGRGRARSRPDRPRCAPGQLRGRARAPLRGPRAAGRAGGDPGAAARGARPRCDDRRVSSRPRHAGVGGRR